MEVVGEEGAYRYTVTTRTTPALRWAAIRADREGWDANFFFSGALKVHRSHKPFVRFLCPF